MLLLSASFADDVQPRPSFTEYARVERADDTYRRMFVDDGALAARHDGRPADDMTIVMESFSGTRLTSVFIKRRVRGEWSYGSIRPGEELSAFRPSSRCADCHQAARASDGMFTLNMLKRFAETGRVQSAFCRLPGRSPCGSDVYDPRP